MNYFDLLAAKTLSGGGGVEPTGTLNITANGNYDVTQYANANVSVPTGGGGFNTVSGDFVVDTETGKAQTVQADYNGNGFPIALFIYPFGGSLPPVENGVVEVVSRYSLFGFMMIKGNLGSPTYDGALNNDTKVRVIDIYKNSTSNADSLGARFRESAQAKAFSGAATALNKFAITSNKTFEFYIPSSPDYTFIPGGHYAYTIVYSE